MKKIQVEFKDYTNGAISPIDTIDFAEDYTPENYLEDYKSNCEVGYENIYDNGEIIFTVYQED